MKAGLEDMIRGDRGQSCISEGDGRAGDEK